MGRSELERLSKEELIELVLRLQRPEKTSSTSSKPPSTDRKEQRERSKPGGAKPGHEGHSRTLSERVDRVVDHRPGQCPSCQTALASDLPASVQDRDTREALDAGKAAWPSLREAILDGAFTAARCQEWSNRHGMRHRVVERDPAQTGFVVLAGRWVVERSFGWLAHWGGLLRDRAGR